MMAIVYAGVFGALASILGKIAVSSTHPVVTVVAANGAYLVGKESLEHGFSMGVRAGFAALMLYVNALMLFYFLKSLEAFGTLPVTVAW
jgi:hypothetical protein